MLLGAAAALRLLADQFREPACGSVLIFRKQT